MRGVRSQLTELISGLGAQDLAPMSLGLSHSLSRYKLKFSPDKVNYSLVYVFYKLLGTFLQWYGWVRHDTIWSDAVIRKIWKNRVLRERQGYDDER